MAFIRVTVSTGEWGPPTQKTPKIIKQFRNKASCAMILRDL